MGKYREQPWERSLIVNLVLRDESRCGAVDNARESDPGMFKVTHRGLDLEVSWGKKILEITCLDISQCLEVGGVLFA